MPGFEECVRCVVGGPASLYVRFGLILLAFPISLGGFVVGARRWLSKGKISEFTLVAVTIFTMITLSALPIVLTSDWPARYSPLVLHEGPFEWPEGCANRDYRDGDAISIACHDYRNTMPRKLVLDHGFRWSIGRQEHDYFRVGNEAINFDCNYFTEKCAVRHAEHNVFR